MEKKPNNAPEEPLEVDDDILLNEDLEDDLLLQEAEAFFGPSKAKNTPAKTLRPPKNEVVPIEEAKTDIKKPVILKTTMKELQQFMVSKAKIFEEMAFHTILRKLPPTWHFTEPILIDVLEALIENDVFQKEKMSLKMTASSVKFYPTPKT